MSGKHDGHRFTENVGPPHAGASERLSAVIESSLQPVGSPSSKNNVALRIDDVALSQGHDCRWIFTEILNLNFHGLWVQNVVLA